MRELTDQELITLALEGDESGFEEIIRRYGRRILQISSRYFRHRDEAEDAAQEALLRIFSKLSSYKGQGSFEGWMIRLTKNVCLNLLRSDRRRPQTPVAALNSGETEWLSNAAGEASAFPTASSRWNSEQRVIAADLAEKLLQSLEPEDQLVLIWLDAEGQSVAEVAGRLDWSESKVKIRAHRGRQKIRRRIEEILRP